MLLKTDLEKYGLSLNNYCDYLGINLDGFYYSNRIKNLNPSFENKENVFDYICLNILNLANNFLGQTPEKLKQENYNLFKQIVGEVNADNLRRCVFEEIKFRLNNNILPELFYKKQFIGNINFSDNSNWNYNNLESFLNPQAVLYLQNSNWNNLNEQIPKYQLDISLKQDKLSENQINAINRFVDIDLPDFENLNTELQKLKNTDFLNTTNADEIIRKKINENLSISFEEINEKIEDIKTKNVSQESSITFLNNAIREQNNSFHSENNKNTERFSTLEQQSLYFNNQITDLTSKQQLSSNELDKIKQKAREIENEKSRISSQINNVIQTKADKSSVYTKSEIDARLRSSGASQTINNGDAKSPNDCRKIGVYAGNFSAQGSPINSPCKGTIINLTTSTSSQGIFLQFFITENEKIFMRKFSGNFSKWEQLAFMSLNNNTLNIKL
ncbi:hypothetical protein [Metamycoplasma gateae]|uniref:Uncharacterized protein n=1 Tax=Metamycoplasma gateae TaxID=35769 RepID=A0ABZ2AGP5_9BACT|nr:hypothetical protein V2E26_02605 [Metamycoplasma gateae]